MRARLLISSRTSSSLLVPAPTLALWTILNTTALLLLVLCTGLSSAWAPHMLSSSPSCPKMASFGPEIQPAQQLTWQNGPYLEISRLTRILSSISSSSSSDRKKQQQGRSWPCFCNSVRHMQKFLAEWLIGAFAGKEALRSEMLHSSGYCTQPPDPCPAATPCSSTSSMSVYLQAHCMRAQKHTGTGNVPLPSLHSDLVNPPHAGGPRQSSAREGRLNSRKLLQNNSQRPVAMEQLQQTHGHDQDFQYIPFETEQPQTTPAPEPSPLPEPQVSYIPLEQWKQMLHDNPIQQPESATEPQQALVPVETRDGRQVVPVTMEPSSSPGEPPMQYVPIRFVPVQSLPPQPAPASQPHPPPQQQPPYGPHPPLQPQPNFHPPPQQQPHYAPHPTPQQPPPSFHPPAQQPQQPQPQPRPAPQQHHAGPDQPSATTHVSDQQVQKAAGQGGGITIQTYTPVTVENSFGDGSSFAPHAPPAPPPPPDSLVETWLKNRPNITVVVVPIVLGRRLLGARPGIAGFFG